MIEQTVAKELNISPKQVAAVLELFDEGATVPFIARYRKEVTGELNEEIIRAIESRFLELKEFEKRKEFILKTLEKQGELTDALKKQIANCTDKHALEDIYLPYKQGKATRAAKAKLAGLEPIATAIYTGTAPQNWKSIITDSIRKVAKENGFDTDDLIRGGIIDILAETIANTGSIRDSIREEISEYGQVVSRAKRGWKGKESKFDRYYEYSRKGSTVPAHVLSALFRGENEGILAVEIETNGDSSRRRVFRLIPKALEKYRDILDDTLTESLDRLLLPSLSSEYLRELKEKADIEACQVFAENLGTVLMSSPAGSRPVLAIDPGFRTGCKAVILDAQGTVIDFATIYPTEPHRKTTEAADILFKLFKKVPYELIAVGNGTGGRETEQFLKDFLLPNLPTKPTVVSVSESGASVYSASPAGIAEFPDLDVTIRGAISIGRRLQDPLAELVKVPPESIGVGQYQHDISATRLTRELNAVVESCVNRVGADLNLASEPLLTQISGIGPTMAKKIVAYRRESGRFKSRKELLKVAGLGKKCFEQCAGFLRITDGDNPLDSTAVHPENYSIVETIAKSIKLKPADLIRNEPVLNAIDLKSFVTESAGTITLSDIVTELKKPARDPRSEFVTVSFDSRFNAMEDLTEGVILQGIVTNVVAFGAFVDIGVHQDGLVHISELANKFVSNASEIVKPGDPVKVKVIGLDLKKKQIALSMKQV